MEDPGIRSLDPGGETLGEGSADLEKLLQTAEAENLQMVKLIDTERQKHDAFQKQIQETVKQTDELEESTKNLDTKAKELHNRFKQNREICEGLKKTATVLDEHEEGLRSKLSLVALERQAQTSEHSKVIEKYEKMWERFFKKYESLPLAVELAQIKQRAIESELCVKETTEKIETIQSQIIEKEVEKTHMQEYLQESHETANDFIIKIAKLFVNAEKKAIGVRGKLKELKDVREKISDKQEKQREGEGVEEDEASTTMTEGEDQDDQEGGLREVATEKVMEIDETQLEGPSEGTKMPSQENHHATTSTEQIMENSTTPGTRDGTISRDHQTHGISDGTTNKDHQTTSTRDGTTNKEHQGHGTRDGSTSRDHQGHGTRDGSTSRGHQTHGTRNGTPSGDHQTHGTKDDTTSRDHQTTGTRDGTTNRGHQTPGTRDGTTSRDHQINYVGNQLITYSQQPSHHQQQRTTNEMNEDQCEPQTGKGIRPKAPPLISTPLRSISVQRKDTGTSDPQKSQEVHRSSQASTTHTIGIATQVTHGASQSQSSLPGEVVQSESRTQAPVSQSGMRTLVTQSVLSTTITQSGSRTPLIQSRVAFCQSGTRTPVSQSGPRTISEHSSHKPISQSESSIPVRQSASCTPVSQSGSRTPISQSGSSTPVSQSGSSIPVSQSGSRTPINQSKSRATVSQSEARSPLDLNQHMRFIRSVTQSPGEGFTYQGRPMYNTNQVFVEQSNEESEPEVIYEAPLNDQHDISLNFFQPFNQQPQNTNQEESQTNAQTPEKRNRNIFMQSSPANSGTSQDQGFSFGPGVTSPGVGSSNFLSTSSAGAIFGSNNNNQPNNESFTGGFSLFGSDTSPQTTTGASPGGFSFSFGAANSPEKSNSSSSGFCLF